MTDTPKIETDTAPQNTGLEHVAYVDHAVQHIPEVSGPARRIETVAVVGGGTMGTGIAAASLIAGLPVTLVESDADRAARAAETIGKIIDGAVRRGKVSAQEGTEAKARLQVTEALQAAADSDLIIEAIFEDMAAKRDLFGTLDRICHRDAILASNTSFLDIDQIAQATTRPGSVLGLHFFSPAHIMRLVEVIPGARTSPQNVATGFEFARRLGKVAVRAGNCDGFIGNRILSHYKKAADYLLLDGASVQQIDSAIQNFGFAMGPFAVSDLGGLDIGWAMRKRRAPNRPPEERYVAIADRLCERGWFGRKTGRGFYDYDASGTQSANPELDAILASEREAAGVTVRHFSDEEICERYLTAMIVEATRVIADGTALRPLDVDTVFLYGYGFPRDKGGPMHHADRVGARRLVENIEAFAADDPHYWQVPPLLRDLAERGSNFAKLNERRP